MLPEKQFVYEKQNNGHAMEMRLACDMKIFAMQQVQLESFRVSGPRLSRATWPKANSLQTDLAFYLALPFDFHFTFLKLTLTFAESSPMKLAMI